MPGLAPIRPCPLVVCCLLLTWGTSAIIYHLYHQSFAPQVGRGGDAGDIMTDIKRLFLSPVRGPFSVNFSDPPVLALHPDLSDPPVLGLHLGPESSRPRTYSAFMILQSYTSWLLS